MFKKYSQKLTSAVLLLFLLSVLVCSAALSVWAAPEDTRDLVVEYDSNCSVILTVDGVTQPSFASGVVVQIPYLNNGVTVSVKPNPGYDIDAIYEVENGVETKLEIATVNGKWSTEFFNRDVNLKIVCKEKTYRIEFLPEANETELSYEFISTGMPSSYTYKGSPVTIGPVRKNSGVKDADGYLFKYWEIVHKETDGTIKAVDILELDSSQNVVIGSDTTILNIWQESGVIYLRPYFEPKDYPVWRNDIVVLSPTDLTTKRLLNANTPATWNAPMASEITGAWGAGEVSPYPGYEFFSFTTSRVTMDENGEKKNQVNRYFLPISYALTLDAGGGSYVDPSFVMSATHVYDQTTPLPNLQRTGYTFIGWSVRVNGTEVQQITDLSNLYLNAEYSKYAENNDGTDQRKLELVAIWQANPYQIDYDLSGAMSSENTNLPSLYYYDTALAIPTPVRAGYRFVGWVVNGDTDHVIFDLTLAAETYTSNISLKAVWEARSFEVILDSNGGLPTAGSKLNQEVVFDQPLNTTGIQLPTRSQYEFLGFYFGDKLYINADGSSACTAWDLYTTDASTEITLTAKWKLLPVMTVDPSQFELDYPNEKFQFPAGSYKLTYEGVSVEFTVDADGFGAKKIPESFFGNTVELIVLTTDDTLYSDYHGTLAIAARPEAPTRDNGVIDQVFSTNTTIEVLFKTDVDPSLYEIALYLDGKTVFPWSSTMKFETLKEGTSYVVLVRKKATDSAPCSSATQFNRDTDSKGFKEALRKELDALIQEGDGDMVLALISNAKNALEELEHSITFYEDAHKIVADTAQAVVFARYQDQKVTALRNYRDALLSTKSYNQTNQAEIESIFRAAEIAIQNATDDKTVSELYNEAYHAMSQIKITYLQNGDFFLTSTNGLHKDYALTVVRHPDFATQADLVNSAISAGKVFGDGSPEELVKLLKTKDVMAAYTMSLSGTDYSGRFKVTLKLPEELRGVEGLRVAYYDKATGTLQVLETDTEGDYLSFYANRVSDFVILGDPVLNLTVPLIALGIVALCQLIAIALLLKERSNSKKAVRNYSLALPMVLTIRFFPKNGELVVLILGALVILLQILLTVLLLRSDVIHKSRLKRGGRRSRHQEEDALPTMANAEDAFASAIPTVPPAEDEPEEGEPEQVSFEAEQAGDYGAEQEMYEDLSAERLETEEEPFYYASVNTENEANGVFEEPEAYEFSYDGEEEAENSMSYVYEEPTFAAAEDAEGDNAFAEDLGEAAEDEGEIFFAFDEDLAYGDPAEPPYEEEAVFDGEDPERTETL